MLAANAGTLDGFPLASLAWLVTIGDLHPVQINNQGMMLFAILHIQVDFPPSVRSRSSRLHDFLHRACRLSDRRGDRAIMLK